MKVRPFAPAVLVAWLLACATREDTSVSSHDVSGRDASGSTVDSGASAAIGSGGHAGSGPTVTCSSDEKLVYEEGGCGKDAVPRCEPKNLCYEYCNDHGSPECLPPACDCDGNTVILGCGLSDKPFRHWGACTDGGDAAPSSGARKDSGADASACWQPITPDGFPSGPGKPSDFDASTFGCYPPSKVIRDFDWAKYSKLGMPLCPGARCGMPRDLPCGSCTEPADYACWTSSWAACDCGQGPFLDQYEDGWICRCVSTQWDCRLTGPSGASCQVCWSQPTEAGPG